VKRRIFGPMTDEMTGGWRELVKRRIFGPMTDEMTGGWRELHNEELHNL
jgi:hypothetical protein